MSRKLNLFDDNSDEDEGNETLTINKNYAERYEEWREAELKRQLEDRYGNAYEEVSSSSSDDDEDPQALKKVLSKDFFEVISSLKTKNPKIYNSEVKFFQNEKSEGSQALQGKVPIKKDDKEKPVYLRDYERKLITERGGELSDDDSDIEQKHEGRSQSPTYVEEQRRLKESFRKVLNDSDDEDCLLKKKDQTNEEKEKEEEDYIEWLKGQRESLEDKETEKSLKPLQKLWNDPKLDEGEKFLRDYILNKRYLESDDTPIDAGDVTDDDLQDEYMNTFERKYNFRYEEPDREFLKRYPRTLEQSMRKKDTRRKERREAVKQRKEEEQKKKREELKLLKSLKRKEILKKIEKIKAITGNDELGLNPDELEEDFDPEAHDRKMRELFNENYYKDADEAEDEDGLNLPPLEEELIDDDNINWDEWDGTDRNEYPVNNEENVDGDADFGAEDGPHCEDQDFNMDCDYDPSKEQMRLEEKSTGRQSAREKRKLKRQSRFGRLVRKDKPVFDPNDKTFQQYVDEYYGMDYEDLIGDIPCRFKYKSVIPNSFGLTIEEILAADDKELNQWASIKKAYTIRPEAVEKYESKVYAQKAQNEELKRKILPSLFKQGTTNENEVEEMRKNKKNKGKKDYKTDQVPNTNDDPSVEECKKEKKKKKRKMDTDEVETENSMLRDGYDPGSLVSSNDELNVEKCKNKKKRKMDADLTDHETVTHEDSLQFTESSKKQKKNNESASDAVSSNNEDPNVIASKKKKKKKRKMEADATSDELLSHLETAAHAENNKNKKKKSNDQTTASPQKHQNPEHVGKKARKSFNQKDESEKNVKISNNKNLDGKRKQLSNFNDSRKQNSDQKTQNFGKNPRNRFHQHDGSKKKSQKLNAYGQGGGRTQQITDLSDERLKAYGIHPKRYRNKLNYAPKK